MPEPLGGQSRSHRELRISPWSRAGAGWAEGLLGCILPSPDQHIPSVQDQLWMSDPVLHHLPFTRLSLPVSQKAALPPKDEPWLGYPFPEGMGMGGLRSQTQGSAALWRHRSPGWPGGWWAPAGCPRGCPCPGPGRGAVLCAAPGRGRGQKPRSSRSRS